MHVDYILGGVAATAALCLVDMRGFQGLRTELDVESTRQVAESAKTFHARGRGMSRKVSADSKNLNYDKSKGAFKCFVVDGKAQCVEAPTDALAKREIIEVGKKKERTTLITPERLKEIKADILANKAKAEKLLADEGWAGFENSQKEMAALIADKIRRLSRMVGTLRKSHDGVVQELIAKAAAPGPRVCVHIRKINTNMSAHMYDAYAMPLVQMLLSALLCLLHLLSHASESKCCQYFVFRIPPPSCF